MSPVAGRVMCLSVLGPLLIGLTIAAARLLPCPLGTILGVWTLLSLPIGVAVGHCALSEDA